MLGTSSGKVFWKESWEFLPDGNIAMKNDADDAFAQGPTVAKKAEISDIRVEEFTDGREFTIASVQAMVKR